MYGVGTSCGAWAPLCSRPVRNTYVRQRRKSIRAYRSAVVDSPVVHVPGGPSIAGTERRLAAPAALRIQFDEAIKITTVGNRESVQKKSAHACTIIHSRVSRS